LAVPEEGGEAQGQVQEQGEELEEVVVELKFRINLNYSSTVNSKLKNQNSKTTI
jgi:hypothetical protein